MRKECLDCGQHVSERCRRFCSFRWMLCVMEHSAIIVMSGDAFDLSREERETGRHQHQQPVCRLPETDRKDADEKGESVRLPCCARCSFFRRSGLGRQRGGRRGW